MKKDQVNRSNTHPDVVDLLCQALRFDTTNPPGNEKPLAEMLAALLKDNGFETEVTDLGDNRANFIARLRGSGERKALMLNGHLDVVPIGEIPWDFPPFDPVVKEGRIYGRGASDMKSGLVAMIVAAIAARRSGLVLKGDLVITGSADEESGSLGARVYRERNGLDDIGAIIVGEPSSGNINIAEKGTLWIKVTTIGKTAHGAFPDRGVNAIVGMNSFMTELLKYDFTYTPHELLGHPTMNFSVLKGGVKENVVPDRCFLIIDFRTVPGMDHGDIVADLQKICEQVKTQIPGLGATVEPINDRPAVETSKDHPFVKLAQTVVKEKFGRDAVPQGVNFYTDAAIFLPGTDIPAILYGPGEAAMAHQPNEYVSVVQLEEAVEFYSGMIDHFLAS